ncbi:hypothetical protein [Agromyces larvae]|uniref:Uncharacterized protein n=1 Tax=Agromyces larvae TaxID=2929802 RepID=A0ABY4BXG1_9MICO|nr:hypothetical protein [Agromyces larvae]UOE43819.1 hypothetical protein MTO99_16870 [Agromyces larvae]
MGSADGFAARRETAGGGETGGRDAAGPESDPADAYCGGCACGADGWTTGCCGAGWGAACGCTPADPCDGIAGGAANEPCGADICGADICGAEA